MHDASSVRNAVSCSAFAKFNANRIVNSINAIIEIVFAPSLDALNFDLDQIRHAKFSCKLISAGFNRSEGLVMPTTLQRAAGLITRILQRVAFPIFRQARAEFIIGRKNGRQ